MSQTTQDAFEAAMADVFEGRECQFGHGPRKMLREFYERAQADAGKGGGSRSTSASRAKIGQSVGKFTDLKVGDVFQNDHLRSISRCRRVTRVIDQYTIETEYVDTDDGSIENTEHCTRDYFEQYWNYRYIADPA